MNDKILPPNSHLPENELGLRIIKVAFQKIRTTI